MSLLDLLDGAIARATHGKGRRTRSCMRQHDSAMCAFPYCGFSILLVVCFEAYHAASHYDDPDCFIFFFLLSYSFSFTST